VKELIKAKDPDFIPLYREKLYEVQERLKINGKPDLALMHDFSPGLYMRRLLIPAGTFLIGGTHKTEHLNIAMSGSAHVMIDGEINYIKAPHVMKSGAGVKKVFYILEDMIWATTHVTEETDLDKLEETLILNEQEEKETYFKRLNL